MDIRVEPARWAWGAQSPVVLMVDDLTDGWIAVQGGRRPVGPDDWGAACAKRGSSFAFLRDSVLDRFPNARVTFFVPVSRLQDVDPSAHLLEYRPIHTRPEFAAFLRSIDSDPRFECAYHGTVHGAPGPRARDYVPEFETFESLESGLVRTRTGLHIWREVFGKPPPGGKFPAYRAGRYGDAIVSQCGFDWWCRSWDRGDRPSADAAFHPTGGLDSSVVDIPSTLHGGLLTFPNMAEVGARKWLGYMRMNAHRFPTLRAQLRGLLRTRSVISIQEHITWTRPDHQRQTPNLWDDAPTLRYVLAYLETRNVWHATCSEIARYWRDWHTTGVRGLGPREFELSAPSDAVELSLEIEGLDGQRSHVRLRTRDRVLDLQLKRVSARRHATEPAKLSPGLYRVE
jgi:hypothetical protein